MGDGSAGNGGPSGGPGGLPGHAFAAGAGSMTPAQVKELAKTMAQNGPLTPAQQQNLFAIYNKQVAQRSNSSLADVLRSQNGGTLPPNPQALLAGMNSSASAAAAAAASVAAASSASASSAAAAAAASGALPGAHSSSSHPVGGRPGSSAPADGGGKGATSGVGGAGSRPPPGNGAARPSVAGGSTVSGSHSGPGGPGPGLAGPTTGGGGPGAGGPEAGSDEEFWQKLASMQQEYRSTLKHLYPVIKKLQEKQPRNKQDMFMRHLSDCFNILDLKRVLVRPQKLTLALLDKADKFINQVITVYSQYVRDIMANLRNNNASSPDAGGGAGGPGPPPGGPGGNAPPRPASQPSPAMPLSQFQQSPSQGPAPRGPPPQQDSKQHVMQRQQAQVQQARHQHEQQQQQQQQHQQQQQQHHHQQQQQQHRLAQKHLRQQHLEQHQRHQQAQQQRQQQQQQPMPSGQPPVAPGQLPQTRLDAPRGRGQNFFPPQGPQQKPDIQALQAAQAAQARAQAQAQVQAAQLAAQSVQAQAQAQAAQASSQAQAAAHVRAQAAAQAQAHAAAQAQAQARSPARPPVPQLGNVTMGVVPPGTRAGPGRVAGAGPDANMGPPGVATSSGVPPRGPGGPNGSMNPMLTARRSGPGVGVPDGPPAGAGVNGPGVHVAAPAPSMSQLLVGLDATLKRTMEDAQNLELHLDEEIRRAKNERVQNTLGALRNHGQPTTSRSSLIGGLSPTTVARSGSTTPGGTPRTDRALSFDDGDKQATDGGSVADKRVDLKRLPNSSLTDTDKSAGTPKRGSFDKGKTVKAGAGMPNGDSRTSPLAAGGSMVGAVIQSKTVFECSADAGLRLAKRPRLASADLVALREVVDGEVRAALSRRPAMKVSISTEFGLPVVRAALRTPSLRLPRLVIRVPRGYPRKGSAAVAFERPPLGWVDDLIAVRTGFVDAIAAAPAAAVGVATALDAWARQADLLALVEDAASSESVGVLGLDAGLGGPRSPPVLEDVVTSA